MTKSIEIVLCVVVLVQRMGSTGIVQMLSLVTSWSQGAIKYSKLILLKDLIPYSNRLNSPCITANYYGYH